MDTFATALPDDLGFAARYRAVNQTFDNPFSLALSQRGHYSEVNCLLAGIVYGLMRRRRFIVDESNFEGLKWSDLYASVLPTAPVEVLQDIDPDWSMLVHTKPRFGSVRARVHRHFGRRLPVWNFKIGLAGGVFAVTRQMADAFCQPAFRTPSMLLPGPYAAVHIRRGDKLLGTLVNGSWTRPEGENIPVEAYVEVLRQRAPSVKSVWVMTDDFAAIGELRKLAPDLTFDTLCPPTDTGYHQSIFSSRSAGEKLAERKRLIAETEIAIRSELFVGCFLSNVDRFIVLRHHDPKACYSLDRQQKWTPA